MSEPEELLLEAAHFATTKARALWAGRRPADGRLRLTDVQRRLELLIATLFTDAPTIRAAEPPPPLPFLARLASPGSARTRPAVPLASTDGVCLRLPAVIDGRAGATGVARYRLLALEQAARAARGTPAALPAGDPLVRDLFLLAEAAAVDRDLCTLLPGLRCDLVTERAAALGTRAPARLTLREAAVERFVTSLLAAPPDAPPDDIGYRAAPADGLDWAAAIARRIRLMPGRYRGVAPVALWGTVAPQPDAAAPASMAQPDASTPRRPPRTHTMSRRPRAREATDDEDDPRTGTWIVRADDPQESVEDPMGLQRPADQDDNADPGELGDSLSDLREARLVRTPELPREVLASADPLPRARAASETLPSRTAIVYPEWDYRTRCYHASGAVVHEVPVRHGDIAWAERVLEQRATLVRRVRRDFERLRPRRAILRRQLDGAEVDVDAYVTTAADVLAGASPDARLYVADHRTRRDAAVFLLVDISASTDSWIAGSRRVIDVEREGLLIVCEALAALGDLHAVFAFHGQGASRVELLPLKRFDDRPGPAVRGRISALEPDGYTRVGAAVRHATALISGASARQRLLLLLSDGRPNDMDIYEGRYGLEDTRQAFAEARLQGVHTFCLTVDREAPAYASRVFGDTGYAVLQNPDRLPYVLVNVLRRMLRG